MSPLIQSQWRQHKNSRMCGSLYQPERQPWHPKSLQHNAVRHWVLYFVNNVSPMNQGASITISAVVVLFIQFDCSSQVLLLYSC